MSEKLYHGSCHCGAVKFEAYIDMANGIRRCNCPFCLKAGHKKSLIDFDKLRITSGQDKLQKHWSEELHWPQGQVDHYHCIECGVHTFSKGEDFWAVNVACLDDATEEELKRAPMIFEGRKVEGVQGPLGATNYCHYGWH